MAIVTAGADSQFGGKLIAIGESRCSGHTARRATRSLRRASREDAEKEADRHPDYGRDDVELPTPGLLSGAESLYDR